MTEDFADIVIQSLMDHGMLSTRFNNKTKEQEFSITDFGKEVHQVLEFFVKEKKE